MPINPVCMKKDTAHIIFTLLRIFKKRERCSYKYKTFIYLKMRPNPVSQDYTNYE